MKNRFGWKDKVDIDSTAKVSIHIDNKIADKFANEEEKHAISRYGSEHQN